ncbi:BtrH N-terminal domain-containing protein [Aquimarina sp. MMG016]|uniref:BtrH N-terminal domain-containing protein n=1 Tax=Aquimarina sp. MMG016 TaxID=2822690 RepID=UPI001B3A6B97|nr:BtrH N-terminal domain-containing protein [Aquimarina sp. MMG016]MBQ4821336.1 BtrH N-terminal domain-containing protein [Aquimarina sp. MMG016]
MKINFEHNQSAHCENGVVSNLLKYNGLNVSEPMVFGIGSGVFFIFIPFIKVNYAPMFSFRPVPGFIFSRVSKRLGFKIKRHKFKSKAKAQQTLDAELTKNNPVGLQVGVYNLTYFPDEYRFHFNAHNLVVYGKENGEYLISDPVMPEVTTLSHNELEKVRFAKGPFAPNGHIYYPTQLPQDVDLKKAILKGIKQAYRHMLAPVPIVGFRGIRYVAKRIRKWPDKIGVKKTNHYLGQLVRMQEEIGTGGGGFRFIFAAFLQEASEILENPKLSELSKEMTVIGDQWRDFAIDASRLYKNRSRETDAYNKIADKLDAIALAERAFFLQLKKAIK